MRKTAKHGKSTAAFFDVDGTLVKLTTDLKIYNYLFRIGEFPLWSIIKAYYYVMLHKLDLLKIERTVEFMGFLKGRPNHEIDTISKKVFERVIRPRIVKKMESEVKSHSNKSHMTVLLTNSPEVIINKFRDYLKMDHSIATILEVKNGRYTGRVTRFCYGQKKLEALKEFASRNKVDLSKSYFYTDSFSDLPALLAVGNRIAVNPDYQLKAYAKKHGWRIISTR